MQLRLTVRNALSPGPPTHLVLTAEAGTPLADARSVLLSAAGLPSDLDLHVDGAPAEQPRLIGVPPLVEGATLTASRPHSRPAAPGSTPHPLLELHVVGGPDAGHAFPLRRGRHRIGRCPTADIRVDDVDVSRRHAWLDVHAEGVTVHDGVSTNGTWLDGVAVGEAGVPLRLGSFLVLGSSRLTLRLPETGPAATTPTGTGRLDLNRPPREALPSAGTEIRFPREPSAPERRPLPLVTMLLPLLVSVPMALLWSPLALLLGLSTPVLLLGNVLSDKHSGRRTHRRELARFHEEVTVARARVRSALALERLQREAASPDPARLWTMARTRSSRLWERRPGDPDSLGLRLGTGTVVSRVCRVTPDTSRGDLREELPLHHAPVVLPLAHLGVIGVCGPRERASGLVRHLIAQVAGTHSPRDVRVAMMSLDGSSEESWGWLRWLPHVRASAEEPAWTAVTHEQVRQRVAELTAVLGARRQGIRGTVGTPVPPPPAVVVLLDCCRGLRGLPGIASLLADGPACGIYFLCLDETAGDLPAECRVTVEVTGEVGSTLRVDPPPGGCSDVVADLVSTSWAEDFARALAPLQDATPSEGTTVPGRSRLLELLARDTGLDALDPRAVAAAWARRARSTRVVLGETASGTYAPDLARDGPHVLVGGTTGSGKSELLQTLVVALALGNRPEHLALLLVDYKGGAAFSACADLPHTVGVVTDLDEHLTRRALTSLTAEVRRRERLLREAGARDLEDYEDLVDAGRAEPPLPRLVIVVDEFRALAEELPDFVSGLVRLAAVGRSLGMHLVLATQRPAGVVGPDIQANVNLRIALRVRDRVDSSDVVESPDAATINPRWPGRALARTGSGELVEFQTARVGGSAPVLSPNEPPRAERETWRGLGDLPPPPPPVEDVTGATDLTRLVRSLGAAAAAVDARPPAAPWLPPLPDVLDRGSAIALQGDGDLPAGGLVIGAVDVPATTTQHALVLDPGTSGCLAVVGTARSGRTGVLVAAAAAASALSPADLHLYAVDGSGSGLPGLEGLPHTGAVVRRGEPERLARLLRRLADEVARRRERGPRAGTRPAILLLVDGWEAVQRELEEADRGSPVDDLLQILREGPPVAVLSVLTGERGLLTGRVGSVFASRLLLRTADPTDALLAGVAAKDLPTRMPPGRGVLVTPDGVREVQVAAPDDLARLAREGAQRWLPLPAAALPFRVDGLPDRLTEHDLLSHPVVCEPLPVGVGGEDVVPLGFDVGDTRSLVVAGPPGSGRSTALVVLARALHRMGAATVLVCPRPSAATAALPDGVVVLGAGDAQPLSELVGSGGPGLAPVVLVDDADAIEGTPVEQVLLAHLAAGPARGGGVVVAGGAAELGARFRGLATEVRRGRTGLLLAPTGYADGDVLGVSVPRSRSVRPGRGYLVRKGHAEPVQLATPDSASAGR